MAVSDSSSAQFYSSAETANSAERTRNNLAALRKLLAHAKANADYYKESLKDIDPESLQSLQDLQQLPLLRKSEMPALQAAHPPFGGINTLPPADYKRIFTSPGPIYEAVGIGDAWRVGQALYAAGIGRGDIMLNCFSYHLSPGAQMLESAAHSVGAAVLPTGIGNSEQQVEVISFCRATAYSGTPDFLQVLLDKADETGTDVSSLRKAIVSGGPLFPEMRAAYEARGIDTYQCLAAADVGLVGFESSAKQGLIIAEGIIVELLLPDGSRIAETDTDTIGEITVTVLKQDFPFIRYATGDLSRYLAGASPCGRGNARLEGWLGRADMLCKIKGVFVHPAELQKALAEFPAIRQASLVVERQGAGDHAVLHYASAEDIDEAALIETCKKHCRLNFAVQASPALPSDRPIIDDKRF